MALKVIYALLVGIFISVFVGVGIDAFYQSPKYPEYPNEITISKNIDGSFNQEGQRVLENHEKEIQKVNLLRKKYNRNVSIIALSASVIIAMISIFLSKKALVISDGLLLGSLFTLIYSVIRGFGSDN